MFGLKSTEKSNRILRIKPCKSSLSLALNLIVTVVSNYKHFILLRKVTISNTSASLTIIYVHNFLFGNLVIK